MRGERGAYQLRVSYDVIQGAVSHLCQILPNLLSEEGEVVHEMIHLAEEMLAQLFVLSRYAHRTGVLITLTHHHASQHDERRSAETELICTKQSHQYNVATGLQLSVNLQPYLSAQAVLHKRLLGLRQAYLRRYACKAH